MVGKFQSFNTSFLANLDLKYKFTSFHKKLLGDNYNLISKVYDQCLYFLYYCKQIWLLEKMLLHHHICNKQNLKDKLL